ncbi:MAG: MFS transporter [Desulfohalobiaceae bacterium]|nr:MFS transporter [Desulfohalobiaceae bacterium]MCF8085511.1 MFS transporter [Desulfohalobiaceae bacterium]
MLSRNASNRHHNASKRPGKPQDDSMARQSDTFLRSPALAQSALLAGVFLFVFLPRLIPAPFLASIEAEFGVSHAQAGVIFLYLAVGYGLGLFGSGFLAKALTHRRTLLVSVFGTAAVMLGLSQVGHFFLLKLLLGLAGVFCGLYVPSGISTLTSVVPGKHWGKGLGVHEMAPNSSFFLAPLIASFAGGAFTWRAVYACLGLGALFMGLFFSLAGRGGNFPGEAPHPRVARSLFIEPRFWILVLLFASAASVAFGSYSMLPLYLVSEHGLSQAWANQLISFSRIPCLGVVLASGAVVDRIGVRRTITAALLGAGTLTVFIGLLQGSALQAAVFFQPFLVVACFPAGFTAISTCFSPQVRNLAISLIIPLAMALGTGLLPALLGWFADMGIFPLGFTLHGFLVLAAVLAVRRLDLRQCSETNPQ